MLKNNQGYFLVETIIVLAIVATIITTLYVNSGETYIKHKNEFTKYNTVDGLYSANAVKKYLYTYEEDLKNGANENGYINVNDYFNNINLNLPSMNFFKELDVNKVYLSLYDMNDILNGDELNNDIKENLKIVENDNKCKYRYIVIFNDYSYSISNLNCVSR